jgi:hypothetical protein
MEAGRVKIVVIDLWPLASDLFITKASRLRSEQAGTRRLGSIRRGRKFQTDLCDRLRLEWAI